MSLLARFLCTVLVLLSSHLFAASTDQILGIWWSPEQKTKVQIAKNGNVYYGRIIAVRPESKEMKDTHNPDESLQDRSVLGLEILSGFKFDGDDTWERGSIYDPENGKTYKCKMWFDKENILKIRGYIGISLLGRTVEFSRVQGDHPETQQAGEPEKAYLDLKK